MSWGYGPDPDYSVHRIRQCTVATVAGNHDLAVGTGRIPSNWGNFARTPALCMRERVGAESLTWLAGLADCVRGVQ
jgi:hypothetical protein